MAIGLSCHSIAPSCEVEKSGPEIGVAPIRLLAAIGEPAKINADSGQPIERQIKLWTLRQVAAPPISQFLSLLCLPVPPRPRAASIARPRPSRKRLARRRAAPHLLPMDDFDWIRLAWLVAALILVAPAVLRRGWGGQGLVYAAAWLGIALLIGLAYSAFSGSGFSGSAPAVPPSETTRTRTASVAEDSFSASVPRSTRLVPNLPARKYG
jgi:hypothetical protein